eukprot:CAMPEP_0113716206 /NCGR_PEP_ID=MMETSP0038_2-20120614/33759_1 /TAXON_ID=2898 /ORGANISM="Cryptomonas paramecium" /LENGTH=31 /DNA_ID=CAMNT_0000643699 /DNA_START=306 /DNA_END=401 /DNA_ORIENTATION=- /assembly_acc=CAM_ASM_000170
MDWKFGAELQDSENDRLDSLQVLREARNISA